jgi:DNA polymerase III delta prime subunit
MNEMETTKDQFLFVEKYRPQKIKECILPERLKEPFEKMVLSGELQNLLLSGGPGCGKTTVAKALCNEMKADHIIINCSEDGNIDTLRTKIRNFASTISLSGSKKVVILDEFDYSNPNSMQPALRGFMEEFSKNCRFILTCNYKNKVISPLHSRCTVIDFTFSKQDKPELCNQFFERCKFILENEEIPYDEKSLAKFIVKYFPDFRRILNELQRQSLTGSINESILSNAINDKINSLFSSMKKKDFSAVRTWISQNSDNDSVLIFRGIFDLLNEKLEESSIPTAILILAEYQYKAAFVADPEINISACLVHMMMEVNFK